jgi:serine/threonine protein kinase/tetratricopeptide (TPR) repeat protein
MSEMSPAEEIFFAALEKEPAERAAYLDAACAGQPELRARVEKLLAVHPRVGGFLEPPAARNATGNFGASESEATGSHHPEAEAAGTVVAGRYKLLQPIGEGGMGTVWMADQTEPVKRRVAVKLIRVEKGQSKTILSRFEAERQAIALMDHPHIAKLLDAGETPPAHARGSPTPYFVMELVKGVPLTEYCDAHKLGIPERLTLFMQICSAVQHAHQKGIIHRDLKPTNILVESHDGKPVPKVIDFGLAKATTGLQLTEHTLFTGFGSVMGTPLYMAPEQATFNAVDVDTRADVYALGVILYELLTGTTPLTRDTIKKAALDEMLRLIREQDAPTPSSRLSASDSKPSVAANRQTEPAKLGRFVRGELDWIVLKALSKDRDRRYETANGFARDVERFLNHEPVQAGPPSARYRLKKFVRRNRPQVIAASLILVALLAGIAGTTWGLIEAKRQEGFARTEAEAKEIARLAEAEQRGIAQENERKALAAAEAEKTAKEREATQRAKAEKARDRTRDVLDAMTSSVTGDSLSTQKEISADQKKFLTEVLTYYREFAGEKADDEQTRARTAKAAYRVAHIEYRLGRTEPGIAAFQMARDGFRTLAVDFPAVPVYRQELAGSRNSLGVLLSDLGKRAEAEEQHRLALAIQEKLAADFPTVPAYRQELAISHNNLGGVLYDLDKRQAEAEEQYGKALAIRTKLAAEFPTVPVYRQELASSHNNLGLLLRVLGKRAGAEDQYRKAMVIEEKLAADFFTVPAYQIGVGGSYCNYGNLVREGGRASESLGWFDKAIATLAPVHRTEPQDVTAKQFLRNSYWCRARAYDTLAKHAEAVKDWDRAIELSPSTEQLGLRARRVMSQVQAGQVTEAVVEVAELTKLSNWNAGQWYDFACVYAVASGKVADKKQEYADRAMELLQKAVKSGYKDAARMKKDPDLDFLREREDFKKLLAELEAKAEKK